MKERLSLLRYGIVSMLCAALLSGCLKDTCKQTYRIYVPVYKTLSQVRADMKSSPAQPLENTGKIYVYGKYIFLSEINKGIHVIDNSNPSAPKNISFINVPGNGDLAVKGNYLYADSYSDMVVFDITNPSGITAKKFINQIFPDRGGYFWGNTTNPDLVKVVVGYNQKDTMVDCNVSSPYYLYRNCSNCGIYLASTPAAAKGPMGISGSMSRFTIIDQYLYGISTSDLYAFDISDPAAPSLSSRKNVAGWNIETIYPFKDKLFIGSSNGMFIYDVSNPSDPLQTGQFSHVRTCDPVIADNDYAYVTLRSGTQCQGFTNQLEVLNINNLIQPVLLKTYAMTNPHGLAKDNNLLFICDGKDGLKVYNAANPSDIQLLKTIGGIETTDVIVNNGLAIVVATDGLYQFDYSDKNNIKQVSKISLVN